MLIFIFQTMGHIMSDTGLPCCRMTQWLVAVIRQASCLSWCCKLCCILEVANSRLGSWGTGDKGLHTLPPPWALASYSHWPIPDLCLQAKVVCRAACMPPPGNQTCFWLLPRQCGLWCQERQQAIAPPLHLWPGSTGSRPIPNQEHDPLLYPRSLIPAPPLGQKI